ncbi:MAG: DUF1294 domain-containing protein [Paludibacteraceae bacterium]|nr:DUF1294 domain-containing protein [Paludibacteraceae bacterium]
MNQFITIALCYLLIINIFTFSVYARDKSLSKKGSRRVSEKNLLSLAAIGGSIGALIAMFALRHKTQHMKFIFAIPFILTVHVFLIYKICEIIFPY